MTSHPRGLAEVVGVDMETLKNDGFPQLVFENEIVVNKIFESIQNQMDLSTSKPLLTVSDALTFDNFIEVVCSLQTKSIDEKIERFFKLIDEDGNGMLSYDEIYNLCTRSLSTSKKDELDHQKGDDFFEKLSEYFAAFIFKVSTRYTMSLVR